MYLFKNTATFQDCGQGQTLKIPVNHVDHILPDLVAQTTVYPAAGPQTFVAGIQINLLPGGLEDLFHRHPIEGAGKIETAAGAPDGSDNTPLPEFEKYLLKKYAGYIFRIRQHTDRYRFTVFAQPRQGQGSPEGIPAPRGNSHGESPSFSIFSNMII
jgi:hypothetical protein